MKAVIIVMCVSMLSGCALNQQKSAPPAAEEKQIPVLSKSDQCADLTAGCEKVIAANKVLELCFDAAQGATVIYRFEASAPLEFNLHYHIDDRVFYPVPEHTTAAEKGRYLVATDHSYCLMWSNQSKETVSVTPSVRGASNLVFH